MKKSAGHSKPIRGDAFPVHTSPPPSPPHGRPARPDPAPRRARTQVPDATPRRVTGGYAEASRRSVNQKVGTGFVPGVTSVTLHPVNLERSSSAVTPEIGSPKASGP